MECKFCGAQMPDETDTCPACGKKAEAEIAEETPVAQEPASTTPPASAPEKANEPVSPWKIVAATAVCMLLLMVLVVVIINSVTGRNWPFDLAQKETTETAEVAPVPTEAALGTAEDLGMVFMGVMDKTSYTGDEAAVAAGDEVIARYGDYELTNSVLQVFYWTEFGNFIVNAANNGTDVVASYGLDAYTPMDQQKIKGYDVTWEQYFLHEALFNWWKYAVVNTMADEAGFELSEEDMATIKDVSVRLAEDAVAEGYADVEALIDDRLGASCDMADYETYMILTARGDTYYTKYLEEYEPSDEDVKAFYELNEEYYSSYMGITMDSGKAAAVRHVLLRPEGCTLDENNLVVATDEQWEDCRVKAQAMLDAWVEEGATEEAFAQLATDHTADGGSQTTGGLYSNVVSGQMVEAFDAWLFDESRVAGDYGLVKTEYGYHLMYFVSISEEDAWYTQAKADAKSYGYAFNMDVNARMDGAQPEFFFDKVILCDISEEPVQQTTETTEPTETATATTAATEAAVATTAAAQ